MGRDVRLAGVDVVVIDLAVGVQRVVVGVDKMLSACDGRKRGSWASGLESGRVVLPSLATLTRMSSEISGGMLVAAEESSVPKKLAKDLNAPNLGESVRYLG